MRDETINNTKATTDCAVGRPATVRESLNAAIEQMQRELTRLVRLRDETPSVFLNASVHQLEELVHPNSPF